MDDNVEDRELKALTSRFEAVRKDIFNDAFHQDTIRASKDFIKLYDHSVSSTLQYAEVDAESLLSLIQNLKDFDIGFTEDAVFIDVGCGPGKTLVVMAIMNVFQRAIGVDINPNMIKLANEVVKKYNRSWRSPVDVTEMELKTGDGTFYDWSFAQLVYIQATCFSEEMMQRITNMADRMKPGSILIMVNNRCVIHRRTVLPRLVVD